MQKLFPDSLKGLGTQTNRKNNNSQFFSCLDQNNKPLNFFLTLFFSQSVACWPWKHLTNAIRNGLAHRRLHFISTSEVRHRKEQVLGERKKERKKEMIVLLSFYESIQLLMIAGHPVLASWCLNEARLLPFAERFAAIHAQLGASDASGASEASGASAGVGGACLMNVPSEVCKRFRLVNYRYTGTFYPITDRLALSNHHHHHHHQIKIILVIIIITIIIVIKKIDTIHTLTHILIRNMDREFTSSLIRPRGAKVASI